MRNRLLVCIICISMLVVVGCSSVQRDTNTQTDRVVITLGSWNDCYEIQTLVSDFNASQTEYLIEVQVYYDENIGANASLDRMNAELISGDVPDILYLNSMDVASLKNAGVLMDLTTLMETDAEFKEDNYFMNIWNLFREDGKLYEFVPSFEIGGICGPASLLQDRNGWTIEECSRFMSEWNIDRELFSANRAQMLSYMIQFSSESYLDVTSNSCTFDCSEFIQWLEFVKMFSSASAQNAVMWAGWVNSFAHFVQLEEESGEPMRIVGFPEDNAGGPCAMALCSFGISATTEYKEVCWEFLMNTLKDEYQINVFNWTMQGFPMNRSSLDALISEATTPNEDDTGSTVQSLSDESAVYILQLIDSIDRLRLRHQSILDIIIEEVDAYFQDGTSAEHCAQMVQNRVSIYLSEQK